MNRKPVRATHKEDGTVLHFDSMQEAADYLGVRISSISRACVETRFSYKGYFWEEEEGDA